MGANSYVIGQALTLLWFCALTLGLLDSVTVIASDAAENLQPIDVIGYMTLFSCLCMHGLCIVRKSQSPRWHLERDGWTDERVLQLEGYRRRQGVMVWFGVTRDPGIARNVQPTKGPGRSRRGYFQMPHLMGASCMRWQYLWLQIG